MSESMIMSSRLMIKDFEMAGKTTAAQNIADYDFNVALAGYTPLGVISTAIQAGGSVSLVYAWMMTSSTVRVRTINERSSSMTPSKINIRVLYQKA